MKDIDTSLLTQLKHRNAEIHKGQCGRIAIIAGSPSMLGAAILVALACLKVGSGIVHLLTDKIAQGQVNACYPEIIVHPLFSENNPISDKTIFLVESILKKINCDTVVIGPGLGQNSSIQGFLKTLLSSQILNGYHTVFDGDALSLLKGDLFKSLPHKSSILTPHYGEFHNLFSLTGEKKEITKEASQISQQIIVFKGSRSIISNGKETVDIKAGNPGLATAGSGDVLSGIIAGFLAQSKKSYLSALWGVYLHGSIANVLFNEQHYGFIASDIIKKIPSQLQELYHQFT